MIYKLLDYETGISEYIEDNENLANARLKEIQDRCLELNDYIFTVSKEIVNGSDTVWTKADLENDLEDFKYFVFNPLTGRHEKVNSLTEAKEKLNEVKQNYITHLNLDKWVVVDEIPQPKVEGLTQL